MNACSFPNPFPSFEQSGYQGLPDRKNPLHQQAPRPIQEVLQEGDEIELLATLKQLTDAGLDMVSDMPSLTETDERNLMAGIQKTTIQKVRVGFMHDPEQYHRSILNAGVRVWNFCKASSGAGKQFTQAEDFPNKIQVQQLVQNVLPRLHRDSGAQEIWIRSSMLDHEARKMLEPFVAHGGSDGDSQFPGVLKTVVLCDDEGVPLRSLLDSLERGQDEDVRQAISHLPGTHCDLRPMQLSPVHENKLLLAIQFNKEKISRVSISKTRYPQFLLQCLRRAPARTWDLRQCFYCAGRAHSFKFPTDDLAFALALDVLPYVHSESQLHEIWLTASHLSDDARHILEPFRVGSRSPLHQRIRRTLVLCDDLGRPLPDNTLQTQAPMLDNAWTAKGFNACEAALSTDKFDETCGVFRRARDGFVALGLQNNLTQKQIDRVPPVLKAVPVQFLKIGKINLSAPLFKAMPGFQASVIDLIHFSNNEKEFVPSWVWTAQEFQGLIGFLTSPPNSVNAPDKKILVQSCSLTDAQARQLKDEFDWIELPAEDLEKGPQLSFTKSFRPAAPEPEALSQVDMPAIQRGVENFIKRGIADVAIGLLKGPDSQWRPFTHREAETLRHIVEQYRSGSDAQAQQAADTVLLAMNEGGFK